jgi:hypothetical protein
VPDDIFVARFGDDPWSSRVGGRRRNEAPLAFQPAGEPVKLGLRLAWDGCRLVGTPGRASPAILRSFRIDSPAQDARIDGWVTPKARDSEAALSPSAWRRLIASPLW